MHFSLSLSAAVSRSETASWPPLVSEHAAQHVSKIQSELELDSTTRRKRLVGGCMFFAALRRLALLGEAAWPAGALGVGAIAALASAVV